jgi:hypothetical protein
VREHLHRVGASGGDQNGRLTVGVREVCRDDCAALRVRTVSPVAEVGIEGTTELGLSGPSLHQGMTGSFSPHRTEVAEGVLAVLLPDVGEVSAATENGSGTAGIAATAEVLGVGEEGAPLGLQEVDDPQVLPELFELGACGGKEVHVGVAGPPSLGRQVGHPPDPEGELALPGVDPHGLAEWFVLEPAGDLDVDVAAGKPTWRVPST